MLDGVYTRGIISKLHGTLLQEAVRWTLPSTGEQKHETESDLGKQRNEVKKLMSGGG